MKTNHTDSWIEVDLRAIQKNIREIGRVSGKPVMAIIKANAYGHGILAVAQAAEGAGCPFLGVARFQEAKDLRSKGIRTALLVLGKVAAQDAPEAAALNIRVTLFDPAQIAEYEAALANSHSKLLVHAKVDTGMGRLGVLADQALPFLQAIAGSPAFELEGLFSHFAKADEPGSDRTEIQFQRFDRLVRQTAAVGIRPRWIHLANSAGALFHPHARAYDLVRGGIAIYGLHPSDSAQLSTAFQPALTWKSALTSVKMVPLGQEISYGGRYTVPTETARIGVVSIGYADGFRRVSGNVVLVRGKRVPVLGTICMDQCMVDLNNVPDAAPGDEVTLIGSQVGSQGEARITAEEVARAWGTVNYEVVCGISARVNRFYTPEPTGTEG